MAEYRYLIVELEPTADLDVTARTIAEELGQECVEVNVAYDNGFGHLVIDPSRKVRIEP